MQIPDSPQRNGKTGLPESLYDDRFFKDLTARSLASARVVVPKLISLLNPRSILDVGCGEGAWLSVFNENGINDCYGIDGDYVDCAKLLINERQFLAADLSLPFNLGRKFDLAICLEVAEHLPDSCADDLVSSLAAHADCVVFSASIPFQDGTGHINEQWPAYWARKFEGIGYKAHDCIRPAIWNENSVGWWFAQNMIIYSTAEYAKKHVGLGEVAGYPLSLVHPGLLLHKEERHECYMSQCSSMRWLCRQLARAAWKKLTSKGFLIK